MRHIAEHVVEDVPRRLGMAGLAADQEGIEIQLRQLRVVVEHLLEMRHQPFGIHRVAGEAAAELVVNTARGHAVAGVQHHANSVFVVEAPGVAQQELRLAGLRELGRAAEPAVPRVVSVLEEDPRVAHDGGGQHQRRMTRSWLTLNCSRRAWMSAAELATSARRFCQTCLTCCNTCKKPDRPWRLSGGK